MTIAKTPDHDGTKTLILLGAVGAYGLLAYAVSFVVRYVSWIGAPESIAKWTVLMLFLWILSGIALVAIDRGAPLSRKFGGVYFLGPILAFVFGKVDVIGALLYFVPPAITVALFIKRANEANEARLRALRSVSSRPDGASP